MSEDNIIDLAGKQELPPDIEFNRALNIAAAMFFSRGGTWQVAHAILSINASTLLDAAKQPQEPPPGTRLIGPGLDGRGA